jgi:NADH-quinone oxidoreductase subunit A
MDVAESYIPLLHFFFCSLSLVGSFFLIARWIKKRSDITRNEQHQFLKDQGFSPIPFSSNPRFYAILFVFILCIIIMLWLCPWVLAISTIGLFGFFSMMMFLTVITVGLFFLWKKNTFDLF